MLIALKNFKGAFTTGHFQFFDCQFSIRSLSSSKFSILAKKFLFNPILGSYVLLNKSFNNLKTKGHELLLLFREYLEDDDVRALLHIKENNFESIKIEIFDLTFLVRMEIMLAPNFNSFKRGTLKVYFCPKEQEMKEIGISYHYDQEGRLFKGVNKGNIPDLNDMSALVLDFVDSLVRHIMQAEYVSIPNQTFEE